MASKWTHRGMHSLVVWLEKLFYCSEVHRFHQGLWSLHWHWGTGGPAVISDDKLWSGSSEFTAMSCNQHRNLVVKETLSRMAWLGSLKNSFWRRPLCDSTVTFICQHQTDGPQLLLAALQSIFWSFALFDPSLICFILAA